MTNSTFSKKIFFIFIIILYFASRFIFLDSDLPPWDLLLYTPLDELFYTIPAFNILHYNTYAPTIIEGIPPDSGYTFFIQFILYLTLQLFGNTYYGLRSGAIFIQLVGLFFFIITVKQFYLNKLEHYSHTLIRLLLLYVLIDFTFLMSSRIIESTVMRFSFSMLIFYMVISFLHKKTFKPWYSLLFGFITVFNVLFVYLQDIYVVFLVYIVMVIYLKYIQRNKGFCLKETVYYLMGGSLSFILFIFTLYILTHQTFIQYLDIIFELKNRTSLSNSLLVLFQDSYQHFLMVLSTNFFRHNLSLLLLFLIFLPKFMYSAVKEKSIIKIYVSVAIILIFMNSIFFYDFAFRKYLILYPFVLFIILNGLVNAFNEHKFPNDINLFLAGFLTYHICFITTHLTIETREPLVFDDVEILNFLLAIIVFITFLIIKTSRKVKLLYIIILCLFPISLILDYKYIYMNPSYKLKNIMKDLGSYINNEYTFSSLSHSVRLYNTSIPVVNPYAYQYSKKKQKQMDKIWLMLSRRDLLKYSISSLKHKDLFKKKGFRLIKSYPYDNTYKHAISLYKYEGNTTK